LNPFLDHQNAIGQQRKMWSGLGTLVVGVLTLTLLTWRIWWANNASKWQMGFNSTF